MNHVVNRTRRIIASSTLEGEEQNREEGEMAQKKLGGGRNRVKKIGEEGKNVR